MSNCPSCNSSNTKTQYMVWSGGTRTGNSGFSSARISPSGRVSVGGGRGRSTSQSNLAASCAPPKDSSIPKVVVGIIGLMFIPALLSGALSIFTEPKLIHGILNFIVCAPLLGLLIFGLIKLYKRLDSKNKQKQNDYNNSWVCLKCGCRFAPFDQN